MTVEEESNETEIAVALFVCYQEMWAADLSDVIQWASVGVSQTGTQFTTSYSRVNSSHCTAALFLVWFGVWTGSDTWRSG